MTPKKDKVYPMITEEEGKTNEILIYEGMQWERFDPTSPVAVRPRNFVVIVGLLIPG